MNNLFCIGTFKLVIGYLYILKFISVLNQPLYISSWEETKYAYLHVASSYKGLGEACLGLYRDD